MALNILTPLQQVPRRSVAYDATQNGNVGLVTGRWADISSSGLAENPAAAGEGGVYLIFEGNTQPDPTVATTLAGSSPYLPLNLQTLPSSVASGQVALAYGVYRFSVDIEGFVSTSLVVGSPLMVDAVGRLVLHTSTNVIVAYVEAVTSTNLIARTVSV